MSNDVVKKDRDAVRRRVSARLAALATAAICTVLSLAPRAPTKTNSTLGMTLHE